VELFGVAFGILQAFRLLFGSGMVLALVAGIAAIRARNVARHRQKGVHSVRARHTP
jgi:uncharacterized membrane protein YozB (DUF420 family)